MELLQSCTKPSICTNRPFFLLMTQLSTRPLRVDITCITQIENRPKIRRISDELCSKLSLYIHLLFLLFIYLMMKFIIDFKVFQHIPTSFTSWNQCQFRKCRKVSTVATCAGRRHASYYTLLAAQPWKPRVVWIVVIFVLLWGCVTYLDQNRHCMMHQNPRIVTAQDKHFDMHFVDFKNMFMFVFRMLQMNCCDVIKMIVYQYCSSCTYFCHGSID